MNHKDISLFWLSKILTIQNSFNRASLLLGQYGSLFFTFLLVCCQIILISFLYISGEEHRKKNENLEAKVYETLLSQVKLSLIYFQELKIVTLYQ